jgi:hypothetical protein
LLDSGALYRTRVGLLRTEGPADLVFAGFKKGAFSIYFGDAPIFHFDLEGRWQRAFVGSTHYLKSLEATIHTIDRDREGPNLVLRRRTLGEAESRELDGQVRGIALGLLSELEHARLQRQEPPIEKARPLDDDTLREFLGKIASWDSTAWSAHRDLYQATYGPLPFLTPECQNAVILQATLGCAGGASFGKGPVFEHSVRSEDEFQRHAQQVARLMGRRLEQARLAFLAGSDVLRLPHERVLAYLDAVGRSFPFDSNAERTTSSSGDSSRIDGIHVFLDEFTPPRPSREALRDYHDRHLVHVGLGVESGDSEVRRLYRKTWSDDDLRTTASDFRSCGFRISLLILVGAGGAEYRDRHIEKTATLLSTLDLARGDMIFLLDDREVRDPDAGEGDFTPLSRSDWTSQQEQLKHALGALRERGIKVLPYSLEKQWS